MTDLDNQLRRYFDHLTRGRVPAPRRAARPRRRRAPLRRLAPAMAVLVAALAVAAYYTFGRPTVITAASTVADCTIGQLQAAVPSVNRGTESGGPAGSRISAETQPGYYPQPTFTGVVIGVRNVSSAACSLERTPRVELGLDGSPAVTRFAAPPPADTVTITAPLVLAPGAHTVLEVDVATRVGTCAASAPQTVVSVTLHLASGLLRTSVSPGVASGATCAIQIPYPLTGSAAIEAGSPVTTQ